MNRHFNVLENIYTVNRHYVITVRKFAASEQTSRNDAINVKVYKVIQKNVYLLLFFSTPTHLLNV